uniref:Uncharacterized protein n=1 Tax=Rhizophora mucronata TaxID=61149 RepID=A0A2P2PHW3_RHIMU
MAEPGHTIAKGIPAHHLFPVATHVAYSSCCCTSKHDQHRHHLQWQYTFVYYLCPGTISNHSQNFPKKPVRLLGRFLCLFLTIFFFFLLFIFVP